MRTPLQIALAVTASGKSRKKIAAEAGVSENALKRYADGENVTRNTIEAIDATLARYVRFLEPGDTVNQPTVELPAEEPEI